jgi:hypothetical protein
MRLANCPSIKAARRQATYLWMKKINTRLSWVLTFVKLNGQMSKIDWNGPETARNLLTWLIQLLCVSRFH